MSEERSETADTPSRVDRFVGHLRQLGLDPGTVYPNADLETALGGPVGRYRWVIYRAIRRLETEDQRTLVCVATVGYRVALPQESTGLAQKRFKRAARQIGKGDHTTYYTDRSLLSAQERQELDLCQGALLAVARELRSQRRRIIGVEQEVVGVKSDLESLKERPSITTEERAFLRELMAERVP